MNKMSSDSSRPAVPGSGPLFPIGERKMGPTDFGIIRSIGTGNFSEVFQVRRLMTKADRAAQMKRKSEGCPLPTDGMTDFAMKKINKARLKQLHKEREVLMEKHCLMKLNSYRSSDTSPPPLGHENIIQLFWTFQDEEDLYLVMEFCPASISLLIRDGELWEMVSGVGLMDEQLGKFYISQLINAVAFLHHRGIVHRDLKAENILIARDGTLKLIDFGTAIDLYCPEIRTAGNRSPGVKGHVFENFVGTAQFMAPEAIQNKSAGRLCDLWSLGCTIYQMLAGVPPFNAPTEFLTYLLSTNLELDFPPHFSPLAEDLIRSLIKLEPEQRLGAIGPDLHDIRSHPFFSGADFTDLRHLLLGRLPYPPLRDSCFSHMAKNWDRFKQKWIENGWLLLDGTLPLSGTPNDFLSMSSESVPISKVPMSDIGKFEELSKVTDLDESDQIDQKAKDVASDNLGITGPVINWDDPSVPVGLELKSRELLKSFGSNGCYRWTPAKERLLYLQSLSDPLGPRNQSFWDERVQKFLQNGSKKDGLEKESIEEKELHDDDDVDDDVDANGSTLDQTNMTET